MDPPKKENRPVHFMGTKDPTRTASFYKAIGVPFRPFAPGVTHHYVSDEGGPVLHLVPSPAPPKILGIALAKFVPSLRVIAERLCADGFLAQAEAMDVRVNEDGRHAMLKDPDGRDVLLVEAPGPVQPPTIH